MRIALLSSLDFSVPGGAERFFLDCAAALDATIVCLSCDQSLCDWYETARKVRFYPLNRTLPKEPYRQIVGMHLFRSISLNYDFFILTDDMAMRYLVNDVPHLYLMLTPRRAFYDMYYQTNAELPHGKREIFSLILKIFRWLDQRFVRLHVREIAGISHNIRNRIWKVYLRQAKVLYPPIHLEHYQNKGYGDFWLSVSRVDKWKRIDLQIEAFRKMPDQKLMIAGRIYPGFEDLVSNAPSNVKFLGVVSDANIRNLYATCKGFITTAIDEDYGLTPLEAMASEKPVIAVKEGGYLETVIDGYTGYLINPDIESVIQAVRCVGEDPARFGCHARRQAERFDYKIFKDIITNYVNTLMGVESEL